MAILPSSIDYSDRDFDSLRSRLENLARSVFPDWTDFQVTNFGNLLLEMYAFVGDVLAFYQDNQARESRIITATQRKNLIALSRLINFEPDTATPATASVAFTLDAVAANDVVISAGTKVRTEDVTGAVEFQLLADVTIAAGLLTASGTVENSETFIENFQSTALPNQEFELDNRPFIDDTATVIAADGGYTEVDNFLNSTSSDRDFTVAVDQSDIATIAFGNGVNGTIPQGTIQVTYKTGGGEVGNVEVGTIVVLDGTFTDILGNPVQLTVTNAAKASGGANRQTIPQIQQLAPESLRVLNRTVSREDYEINAKKVAGVARALMTTSNEDTGIKENEGILYIIPDGGGVPTTVLKDSVLEQVTETFPNTITFVVTVSDPVYLTVDVDTTVYIANGFDEVEVKDEIVSALTDFFAITNSDGTANTDIDFGFNFKDADGEPSGEIPLSDVFNVVRDITGVRKMGDGLSDFLLNNAHSDVQIEVFEFPQLGTVTIRNGDTGLVIS